MISGQKIWQAYERGADVYHNLGEDDAVWRERHRRRFSSFLQSASILDVGCGPGRDSAKFAQQNLAVTGIDFSPAMLQFAKAQCPSGNFLCQDFQQLALAGRLFGGLWSMFSLLHIPPSQLQPCLLNWRRHLLPQAPLTLATAISSKFESRVVNEWLLQPDNECVFFYHKLDALTAALKAGGFEVLSAEIDTPLPYQSREYQDLGLEALVVYAKASPPAGQFHQ